MLLFIICLSFTTACKSALLRPFGYFEKGPWKLAHAINLDAGTHVNGLGYDIVAMRSQKISLSNRPMGIFYFSGHASVKHYETALGIPGRSQAGKGFLQGMWGWGKCRKFPSRFYHLSPGTAHNIGFYYAVYLSTDGTSQNTGCWLYSYVKDRSKVRIKYENDWYSFKFTDEFRTCAVQVEYFRLVSSHLLGLGTGILLWTGRTRDSFGMLYSHGIFYFSVSFNGIRLQAGMDSEKIRDFIQNKYHRLTGVKTIPLLQRPDRFYLQLSIFDMGKLY